jgi:phage regulator Rha-like protein
VLIVERFDKIQLQRKAKRTPADNIRLKEILKRKKHRKNKNYTFTHQFSKNKMTSFKLSF